MDEDTASEVVKRAIEINRQLNDLLWPIKESCPEEQFKRYRRAVAEAMTSISLDILNPIFAEHPSLMPPELTEE